MEDSIFTKIIKREIPCHLIYEDEQSIAFLDIRPAQPGHTLVVPKKQVEFIWDLSDDDYHYLWSVAKHIAKHMRDTLLCKRVGVIIDGEAVPHVHIQLIPLNGPSDLHSHQPDEPNHTALADMAKKLAM